MTDLTPSLPLSGQAALITGGATGIGLACAEAFVRDGAAVTLMGRRADRLAEAAAHLATIAPGATVVVVAGDVADEGDVVAAVAAASEPLGGLHLAVASAGRGGVSPIVATTLEEWNGVLGTNLTGTFLTFKHAGAAIARSGGGAMCAISSIAAIKTHHFMAPYCVSKAAIDALVQNAADELGVAGVRVNSVRPGLVKTDMGDAALMVDGVLESYLGEMPISRLGTVEDVAAGVRYLCGPEAGWVTGVSLSMDGGHHLRRGPDYGSIARVLYGDAVDGIVPAP